MAMQRPIKYQYETSPRKLQPEYRPARKKYPPKSTAPKQKTATPKISAKKIFHLNLFKIFIFFEIKYNPKKS